MKQVLRLNMPVRVHSGVHGRGDQPKQNRSCKPPKYSASTLTNAR